MLKNTLKKYLFQQPTLFTWIIVLLFLAMLYYIGIGLWALLWPTKKNWESVMAFLFIVPFIVTILLVGLADFFFRKLSKQRLRTVWAIELLIVFIVISGYTYKNSFRSEIITQKLTPVVMLIEDSIKGTSIRQSWYHTKKEYFIGNDNILTIKEPFLDKEFIGLTATTISGKKYKQIYGMSYMQIDTVRCNNRVYKFNIFKLESDSISRFVIWDKQIDSLKELMCKHIMLQ